MNRSVFGFSVLVALVGCTVPPDPVYDATPEQSSGVWCQGREVVTAGNPGAKVAIAFRESRDGMLVYQVEIANRADESVTVDPAAFAYLDMESGERVPAQDPEAALLQDAVSLESLEATQASQATTDLMFSLIDLTLDIATTQEGETETTEAADAQEETQDEVWRLRQAQDADLARQRLDADHYRWGTQFLRKTTLQPGQTIGGRVAFALPHDIPAVELVLPIAGDEVRVRYRITTISSPNHSAAGAPTNF